MLVLILQRLQKNLKNRSINLQRWLSLLAAELWASGQSAEYPLSLLSATAGLICLEQQTLSFCPIHNDNERGLGHYRCCWFDQPAQLNLEWLLALPLQPLAKRCIGIAWQRHCHQSKVTNNIISFDDYMKQWSGKMSLLRIRFNIIGISKINVNYNA